jgi:hypothetical protein
MGCHVPIRFAEHIAMLEKSGHSCERYSRNYLASRLEPPVLSVSRLVGTHDLPSPEDYEGDLQQQQDIHSARNSIMIGNRS